MQSSERIYVAGHRGLAGSALVRRLKKAGYGNLILRDRTQLDLCDQAACLRFFEREKPDHVFLAAARVGGIHANATQPARFLYENLVIQTNVIHSAYLTGVKKLLFLGSSCIYPKFAPQPLTESTLLTGALEETNEAYAVAKIAGLKMCAAYNTQYGCNYLCVMPTNLYGPGDHYDLVTSHVLPALLRKIHTAREQESPSVPVWGTGSPRREFLHSDDMADACVYLMERFDAAALGPFVNVGTGVDITIAELAATIAGVVGYRGRIEFDSSKPDGTPRKVLDVSRIRNLGWRHRIDLVTGIRATYESYLSETRPELPVIA